MSAFVWWEEYRCGCVSPVTPRKRDLLGYCSKHGESKRSVWRARGSDFRDGREELSAREITRLPYKAPELVGEQP